MSEELNPEDIVKCNPETRKSQAKRIKTLFNKYKKWKGAYYNITKFEEPVMFFERRSGEVEFYEKVTAGVFEYKHSNGEDRFQIINPTKMSKFGFANKSFKGYLSHEDYPVTGLPDPEITVEQINIAIEKAISDLKRWKAQEIKEYKGLLKWGLIGIACIIGAVYLGKTMLGAPSEPSTVVQVISNVTPTIIP